MSFSSTAIKQREKELKTLTTFLTYSLIGSLALHIGLLASGIGNLLKKVPVEEPVEITFVETPPEEIKPIEQPEEEIKPQVVDNSRIFTSSNNNSDSSPSVFLPQPQKSTVVSAQPSIIKKQQVLSPVIPAPKIEPLKPLPSITKETVSPKKVATQPQKLSQSKDTTFKPLSTETNVVQPSAQSSSNLSKLLAGIRDGRANKEVSQPSQAISGNGGNPVGTSNSSGIPGNGGNPVGTSNSSGIPGNGVSGSSSGSGSKVATAPTTSKIRTNSGSGNGRAACRECNTNYPDWARRRGVEGRVEVAVDTDNKGNVTNVRLLRSSGNEKLDAEHLERAQKWKLKPSSEGRQGVTIGTEYAIAGSQRYRQLQERKKQRETEQRNTASTNNNVSKSVTETPRRSRRLVTSVSENAPQKSTTETRKIRRRRNVAASTESTSTSSTTKGQRLGEALRRRRRDQAATNTSSSSGETRKRRQRREITPTSSVSNNSESSPKPTRRRRRLEQPASSEQNQQPSQSSDTN